MRAFMRAIGLGGLFRFLTTSKERNSKSNISTVFEVCQSNDMSSSTERQQFVFFCGSDASAVPSGDYASFHNSILEATAQPVIDHRMPVFIMPPLSPFRPSVGVRVTGY
ncbi:uncharacterized protein PHALS_10837 [Plasmopara halstedii]|uniref:Uncharacterized protein n=1 Tax=Plasmopara halstedii TaxID=4781 RepID=A0A0N7L570_PLAHL|nr:uncharacterized protein PHALS_10837 [Plasmopara halstedii]CEG40651.1 hypothetical protein PHALS_10837 [Plasmopara halstedii]|eukprot:XP_024577020.1 hypothetical protein PHALS_10837 [Plasmopara halstedii]